MPFKKVFEKRVNEDMQSSNHNSQSAEAADNEDLDLKKQHPPHTPDLEAEDIEFDEKKDRPPRFSTLFGAIPAPPPPPVFESYPPSKKRKSGIYMPTPLFVVFAVILLFESTLLFAYTVIGLYNNLPSPLVRGTASSCDCEMNKLPMVNIAPNFVMPQAAQAPVVETVTVLGNGALGNSLPLYTSTTSSSTTSSISISPPSASSTEASSQSVAAAAAASDILGLMYSLTLSSSTTTNPTSSSSSSISKSGAVTSTEILSEVSPAQSTVNSIKLITVDASGSTIQPRPTVTSTTVIDASQAAAASSSSAAAESSVQAAMSSISAALIAKPIPSSTTFLTSATSVSPTTLSSVTSIPPSSSSTAPASVSTSSATGGGFCIGGSGAVELDCVPKGT